MPAIDPMLPPMAAVTNSVFSGIRRFIGLDASGFLLRFAFSISPL